MKDGGTVNSQALDSVESVAALISAQAPSHAIAMLDTVVAQTIGMAMYNAVNRQQNAGMISSAAVTSVCARMLNAFAPSRPADPAPPAAPSVDPLDGLDPRPPHEAPLRGPVHDGAAAIAQLRDIAEAARSGAQGIDEELVAQAREANPSASPAGKAYQWVAQASAIAVQDSVDALRNLSTIATTAIGVALAQLLETNDQRHVQTILAAQQVMKNATEEFARVGATAAALVNEFRPD